MSIGFWQVILILLVVLILFGAGRISKVMGELGKGVKSFKDGLNEGAAKPKRVVKKRTKKPVKTPPKKNK